MNRTEFYTWCTHSDNRLRELRELRRELAEKRTGQPSPMMTVKDVARALAVSTCKVASLAAAGELVPFKVGGSNRYTPAQIDAYLRHTVKVGTRRRKRSIRNAARHGLK